MNGINHLTGSNLPAEIKLTFFPQIKTLFSGGCCAKLKLMLKIDSHPKFGFYLASNSKYVAPPPECVCVCVCVSGGVKTNFLTCQRPAIEGERRPICFHLAGRLVIPLNLISFGGMLFFMCTLEVKIISIKISRWELV